MTGMFQPKGDIYEPSSDIPLNWSDMRSVFGCMFGYKLLGETMPNTIIIECWRLTCNTII